MDLQRPALLVLVRHAESARNHAKKGSVYFADDAARQVVRGVPDHLIELTEDGHKQAVQTGQGIRERFGTFDYVYTSGYARTVQTAEGILSAYSEDERARMRCKNDLFIRERDPGFAYDMTTAEAEAAFPWLNEYWQTFGGFMARPPGGESLADVTGRVHTFLDALFQDRAGQKVMVVTHGGTLRCFRFLLEGWSYSQAQRWPEGQSPANCGVTTYRCEGDGGPLRLEDYNQVYWTVGSAADGI
ncbi:histidine phosphatase family protein [Dactylosporangium sp. AC04546]|uniref:histidine phosphatase family protein n=1 Tax=Dactylosporangium sp. AC04546 TaxID=2862460 RepID=UPI001EDFB55A|nr:histidine phosphatase family protein [Dactylosporangium sp. AC04546]WVK82529.1 histidine phosphatase family protein [Dactylosporangium sp. AC04546]